MRFLVTIIVLLVITGTVFFVLNQKNNLPSSSTTPPTSSTMPKQYNQLPPMTIDPQKSYSAVMETSVGRMTISLFASQTPQTVNNFVFLSREKFYEGTKFHRIMQDFMIQGGDPRGDGTGGPGYQFADEPITQEYDRGIVAMANSGKNTNGSQFFVMTKSTPLPKNYVIFGELVGDESLTTLDKIASTPVEPNIMGELSQPKATITITKISIIEE